MARLPENSVKAPLFDTPLRRTAPLEVVPDAEPAAEGQGGEAPANVAEATTPKKRARKRKDRAVEAGVSSELEKRITLRLSNADWQVLEVEAHQRRIAGAKTSASEIAREVISAWAAKKR